MHLIISITIIAVIFVGILFWMHSKKEKLTNSAGYYADTKQCGTLEMRDCLNTSNCVWCVNDNFASQCVAGTKDGATNATCKKYYSNDPWTRSVLANDNDFQKFDALNIIE